MQSTRNGLIALLAHNKNNYVSCQKLSEKLHLSRSAIWKHMKELEKDGYIIEGESNFGYRMISHPGKISENAIQWGLDTKWIGGKIIHKATTPSTQIVAHQEAQNNAAHGTVILADEQTSGRGRMGRDWYSTKQKGIWMSLILRPVIPPNLAPQLTLLTATVLADAIYYHTGIKAQIKWPNDILINGKKVGGILTEMQTEQDQIEYVIIGIGLNINHTEGDLPENLQQTATSLAIAANKKWDTVALIQEILFTFENTFDSYLRDGFPQIKFKWERYGYKIGEIIQIKTSQQKWQAVFQGIAEDGALLITKSNGENQKLYSAEIEWFGERWIGV